MEQKDHDILLGLQRDMCWIKKQLANHLKHHWMLTLSMAGVLAVGIVTVLVKLLFLKG